MKKIKYLALILCLMFIPVFNINAEEIDNNIEYKEKFNVVSGDNLNESHQVNGSSVVAGDNVSVENTVNGIDMVFGNNVTYKGNSDYSLIAGNVINLNGTTKNDGFIFGNAITFDKEYKSSRDLFVFGSSVILRGEIKRDVTIYASTVILEDVKVNGNVSINASSIDIKNVTIEGILSYNEDSEIAISEDAIINEKNITASSIVNQSVSDIVLDNIVDYASLLLTFVALAILLPSMFKKIEKKVENISILKFISMLGYGLFFLIMIPIIFILLAMITIGVPLAILIMMAYIAVIFISTIFTGYFVGLIVWKKFIKKETNILLVGLVGISIVKILLIIPYVNVIATLISLLLSLSIFVKLFTKDA